MTTMLFDEPCVCGGEVEGGHNSNRMITIFSSFLKVLESGTGGKLPFHLKERNTTR